MGRQLAPLICFIFFQLIFLSSCNSVDVPKPGNKLRFSGINTPNSSGPSPTIYTVDQIDDDNTITGFGGASHHGTYYGSGVVTLSATTSYATFDQSWTPKWNDMVAYWKFEESSWNGTSGEVIDSSGNSHHGTSVNSANTTSTAKIESGAADINVGSFAYISVGSSTDFNFVNDFSISLWVKSNNIAPTGDSTFIGQWQGGLGYIFWMTGGNVYFGDDSSAQASWVDGVAYLQDGQWHHLMVVRDSTTMTIYADGIQKASGPNTTMTHVDGLYIGAYSAGSSGYMHGLIDEVAMWESALTSNEVQLIYSRQLAKYSGEMKSRIIDSQNLNSAWTQLDWLATLPFGKELPDAGLSESMTDYSSLSTNTLMDGIIALWHFNVSSTGQFPDSSGNGYNATCTTCPDISNEGLFGPAPLFNQNGSSDMIGLNTPLLSGTDDFTICAWIKPTILGQIHYIAGNYGLANVGGIELYVIPSNVFGLYINGWVPSTSVLPVNAWSHACGTREAGYAKIYFNGALDGMGSLSSSIDVVSNWSIGNGPDYTSERFMGQIDELGVWNRALSSNDIVQLYRRGANRLKFQVRTCANADCSDQQVLDGNGWMGPGGNHLTYFSELHNNSLINSNCSIPQQCYSGELSIEGDVQVDLPSIYFNAFGADGISVNNNHYFQYRTIMESDDSIGVCSASSTCLPELKSVEIGPSHSY